MLALHAACGRLGFDPLATRDASDAPIPDAEIDGAPGYRATAVRFETAGGDYMWAGSLSNTTNSGRGTYSLWLHLNGGDDMLQMLGAAQVVGVGGVVRGANNRLQFIMQNCAAVVLLSMETSESYTASSGWVHLLASWDLGAGRAQIYVNDVADRNASPIVINGAICYASWRWGIGGLASGQLDADVADLYSSLGTSLDLDVEANRRKFRDAEGKPVDLGPNCNNPTGTTPTGCFVGDVATWHMNKGIGEGFNLEGDGLVVAPTSPSD
jgi:hypothetical protein